LGSSKGDRQNLGRGYKAPSFSQLCLVEAYLNWIAVAGVSRVGTAGQTFASKRGRRMLKIDVALLAA